MTVIKGQNYEFNWHIINDSSNFMIELQACIVALLQQQQQQHYLSDACFFLVIIFDSAFLSDIAKINKTQGRAWGYT